MKYEIEDGVLILDEKKYKYKIRETETDYKNTHYVVFATKGLFGRIKNIRKFRSEAVLFDELTGLFELVREGVPEDFRTETKKPLTDYSNRYIQTTLFSWFNNFYIERGVNG